jgi:hypothetical protein
MTTFPTAASDVEHAYARANAGRVEQRLDRLARDRAQKLGVAPGDTLPAGRLELVERLGVDAGHGPHPLTGIKTPGEPRATLRPLPS